MESNSVQQNVGGTEANERGASSVEMDSLTNAGGLAEVRTVINRDNNSGSLREHAVSRAPYPTGPALRFHPSYKVVAYSRGGAIVYLRDKRYINNQNSTNNPLFNVLVILFV